MNGGYHQHIKRHLLIITSDIIVSFTHPQQTIYVLKNKTTFKLISPFLSSHFLLRPLAQMSLQKKKKKKRKKKHLISKKVNE